MRKIKSATKLIESRQTEQGNLVPFLENGILRAFFVHYCEFVLSFLISKNRRKWTEFRYKKIWFIKRKMAQRSSSECSVFLIKSNDNFIIIT